MNGPVIRASEIGPNGRKDMRIPSSDYSFFQRWRVVGLYRWTSINKVTLYVRKREKGEK